MITTSPLRPDRSAAPLPRPAGDTHPGERSARPEPLRGRGDALGALTGALDRAYAHDGSAVAVRGETGLGKTALLRWAADLAREEGWRVLRITGTDRDAERRSGALGRLGRPALGVSAALPDPLRTALLRAVDGDDRPEDALLVRAALHQGLSFLARPRALLVTVDDCHLLDPASARALTYLATRLTGTRIALLAAASGGPGPFEGWEAPSVDLGGLDEDSARLLLADHHPHLAPAVRSAVLATAEGSPLALIDLPRALTPAQRRGEAPLPDPLPAGPALDAALGPRFRGLPAGTRALLAVLAAADGDLTARDVDWAADLVGAGPDALGPAEEAGFVTGDRLPRFTRRIHRSLACSTAPASARGHAHAAWADFGAARSGAPAGRGTAGPAGGDRVGRLDALARTALARGDWSSALRALQRAGELSPLPRERTRRLTAAAATALRCGRPDLALALTRDLEGREEAVTARTLRIVRASTGFDTALTARAAHTALAGALVPGEVLGPDRRDWAAFQLATLSSLTHRPEPARTALDWLAERGARSDGDEPLRIAVAAHLDPVGRRAGIRRGLRALAGTAVGASDALGLRELAWLADAAWQIDETGLAGRLVATALRRTGERDSGPLQHCRSLQAALMVAGGRWAELDELVPELIREAEDEGLVRHAVDLKARLLMVCAYQGRRDQGGGLLREVRRWARDHGSAHHAQLAEHAAHLLASAGGEPAGGARPLLSAADPVRDVVARHAYVDVMRAALARGDLRAARAQDARAVRGRLGAFSAETALLVGHGRALLAAHEEADDTAERFRRAHVAAVASARPFDRARLALDHGVWLRRQRDTAAARARLRTAYDGFARLAAAPWRDRARAELRAVGVSMRDHGPASRPASEPLVLSAQEQRIARMAAAGLSNREIADRLRVSPRTVASHLYKVFPRLGVSSRRELGQVLREMGDRS
ncbi:LuxR family transcriptional regulator [Streptomyces glaucus]|uniref:LuxR family transcriptional regulator n=1 Tax=Streptomyces glaucus TaxID=284029 RepID=A0ABP5XG35_9ACTN